MADSNASLLGYRNRRLRYRELLETVSEIEESCTDSIEKTRHVINETAKLFKDCTVEQRVEHPSESLLDSRVLLATSGVITRYTEKVSGNSNVYDANELADHIKRNPDFWSSISFPGCIPNYAYLFGSFLPEPPVEKVKKQRKQVEKQSKSEKKEPEKLKIAEKAEESEIVTKVNKFINKSFKNNGGKPICFFKLVLHPHSFAKTIENIYHVSFLVRDGFVSITIDEESELPCISPVSKNTKNENETIESKQFIMSLTMNEWKEAVKAFKIKEPFMKNH